MALYKPKPDAEPKSVWVKNPVGRIVHVLEDAPEVKYAREEEHKWRLATPDEIRGAKDDADAKAAVIIEKQKKQAAAGEAAKALTAAVKNIKAGKE